MTISLRATRSFITNDVSLDGPVTVNQGTTNTYTITDYNRFSSYSATASVGTISISGATVTLVVPSTSATQIKMSVSKDNTISIFNVAVGATAIITPSLTSPIEGAVNVNASPTLAASPFTTAPAGADTHQSSQWQVSTNSAFTAIVFDSGVTTTNKTSISVPTLALNTIHYARVRYTGTILGTSAWSATRSFTTTNQYIATPAITTTTALTAVGGSPTFTGSAFSPVGGTDTHSASDWILTKVSDNSVVYQSIGDTTNKTNITIPSGLLVINTQYRIRLRYAGASLGYSSYGQLDFTTASKFSYEKYLALALGDRVKVFGQDADTLVPLPDLPPLRVGGDSNVYYSGGTVTFSPNGQHLVASYGNRGLLTIYKRSGDTFSILTDVPVSNPTGTIAKVSYSGDGNYMIVAAGKEPIVYQVTGDTYNRMSDLPSNPPILTYSVAMNQDGSLIAVGKSYNKLPTSNVEYYKNLFIYRRVGSSFSLVAQSTFFNDVVRALRFSPDSKFLAVGGNSYGTTTLLKMAADGNIESLVATLSSSVGYDIDYAWSPDSTKLLVTGTIPRIYRRDSDTAWTRLAWTTSSSNSSVAGFAGASWSSDNYIVTSTNTRAADNATAQTCSYGKISGDLVSEIPFPDSVGLGTVGGARFWPGYQG